MCKSADRLCRLFHEPPVFVCKKQTTGNAIFQREEFLTASINGCRIFDKVCQFRIAIRYSHSK